MEKSIHISHKVFIDNYKLNENFSFIFDRFLKAKNTHMSGFLLNVFQLLICLYIMKWMQYIPWHQTFVESAQALSMTCT